MLLAELVEHARRGAPPPKPYCAITFDDGYLDNYTIAFPLLREMQMPAVFFLTAGLIGTSELLWPDQITLACARLSESPRGRRRLDQLLLSTGAIPSQSQPGRRLGLPLASSVIERLKILPRARIEAFLSEIRDCRAKNRPDQEAFRLLTWDQVREMMAGGMCFGAHTVSHCILVVEERQDAQREIEESKAILESKLGTVIDAIAYPNGQLDSETVHMAQNAGFRFGLTLESEHISERCDPACLGRFVINQQEVATPKGRFSVSLFEYRTSALVLFAGRMVRRLLRRRSEKRQEA